jgi:hypothetical protein
MPFYSIICPHCSFAIPITGQGSKTVIRVPHAKVPKPDKPKGPSLAEILVDHYDAYWRVANIFGKPKNFKPSDTATTYMELIAEGATDEMMYRAALALAKGREMQYMPQLLKWLEGRSFLPQNEPPQGTDNAQPNRLLPRLRAE